MNHQAMLIRFNKKYSSVPLEIQKRSMSISEDIAFVIHSIFDMKL